MKLKLVHLKIKTGIILLGFLLLSACSRDNKTFEMGYTDKDKLIKDFSEAVFSNDQKKITELLVNRKEYRELIHPYIPEGDIKNGGIEADKAWEIFIVRHRDNAIDTYLKSSLNGNCTLEDIGKHGKVETFGRVKFYRETEITYSCENEKHKRTTKTNNRMIAVIVKKGSKFKVLNSFRD